MTVGRSSSPTHQCGAAAEDAALVYLQGQQCTLLTQNFNTPYGELDLVVLDKACIVFVEVRSRRRAGMVSAVESVTPSKQKKIVRSAMHFLQQFPQYSDLACRFDVVAITHGNTVQGGAYQPVWIQSAFDAGLLV